MGVQALPQSVGWTGFLSWLQVTAGEGGGVRGPRVRTAREWRGLARGWLADASAPAIRWRKAAGSGGSGLSAKAAQGLQRRPGCGPYGGVGAARVCMAGPCGFWRTQMGVFGLSSRGLGLGFHGAAAVRNGAGEAVTGLDG